VWLLVTVTCSKGSHETNLQAWAAASSAVQRFTGAADMLKCVWLQVQGIWGARIPVLKYSCSMSGLDCDISLQVSSFCCWFSYMLLRRSNIVHICLITAARPQLVNKSAGLGGASLPCQ
jgi:hypothetical protein